MGIAQRCKPRATLVLSEGLYTRALLRLLQVSPRLFLAALRTWRGHLQPSSSSATTSSLGAGGGDAAASSLAATPSSHRLAKDGGEGLKGGKRMGLVDPAALLANAAKLWQVKKGLSDAGSMLLRGVANVANVMSNVGSGGGLGGGGVGGGGGGAASFGEGEVVMDGAVLPLFFEEGPSGGHPFLHHSAPQHQGSPLYNCAEVGKAVDEALKLHAKGLPLAYLLDARADLHLLQESPRKALEVYLQHAPHFSTLPQEHKLAQVGGAPVGATAALSLLYRYNLWESVAQDAIQKFMSLGEACIDAMVDGLPEDPNALYPPTPTPIGSSSSISTGGGGGGGGGFSPRGYFPLPRTLSQLEDSPTLQFSYLHALFTRRQGDFNAPAYSPYHSTLLTLYPRFLPDSLLPFLLHSKLYPMKDAEDMCMASKPPLWRGLALVKVRSGYVREALDIYTSKLQDVPAAVDFIVSAGGDAALWGDLLEAVVGCGEGEVVGRLLECLPRTGLSPSRVLNAIPPHLPIPHLQRRLLALLRERDAARRMNVITSALVRDDIMRQHEKTVERSRRGILFVDPTCAGCGSAPKDSLASKRDRQGGGGGGGGGGGVGLDGDGEDGEAAPAPPLIHIFFCGHLWHGECLGDAGGGVGVSSSSSSSLPSPSHGSFYSSSSSSSSHPPLHPNAGKGSSLAATTPSRFSPQGQSRSRAASRADVTPQYGGGWGNDNTPEWGAPGSGGGVGTRSRTSSVLADSRVRPRGMSDAAAPSPPSFSPRGGGGRGGKAPTLRCPLCK